MFRASQQAMEVDPGIEGWGEIEDGARPRHRGLSLSEGKGLKMNERIPAEAFPPGEFLADELEARGWTQTEFAGLIGRPTKVVNEVIAGKKAITPDTAR